ncbi:MAG: porin family protein [Treponema sp.]|nr:porin family protein [Treponema sp.]
MKKLFVFIMVVAVATSVFAQNETEDISENEPLKKHQFLDNYFGVSIGAAGMKTSENGIFTVDIGVTYGFYLHDWVSINTGLLFHTELYSEKNLLTGNEPMVTPLCFTIPFGIHFNIPKAEWLYTGVNVAVNIPIADFRSWKKDDFSQKDVFLSLPIDLGFDFIKPGRGGSRAFLRITPTFHNGGTVIPIGFVWQIYNWKVFAKQVEVNVPTPPTVIIIH